MRRAPLLCFIIAALFAVAALNEGHLNHWGITIVLVVAALALVTGGVLSLRRPD